MWLVDTKLWPNSQLPTYIKLLGHNWTTKDILLFFLSILPANCKAGISAYSVIQKSRHILNRRSSTTARILQNWKHKKTSALVIQEVSPKRERFTWSPPLLFFVKMSNSMFAKTRFDRDRRSNLPFQKLHINSHICAAAAATYLWCRSQNFNWIQHMTPGELEHLCWHLHIQCGYPAEVCDTTTQQTLRAHLLNNNQLNQSKEGGWHENYMKENDREGAKFQQWTLPMRHDHPQKPSHSGVGRHWEQYILVLLLHVMWTSRSKNTNIASRHITSYTALQNRTPNPGLIFLDFIPQLHQPNSNCEPNDPKL